MNKHVDLLQGPIFPSLTKLALPIMATSLIQMAYNMTDMIWIGRLGSGAVAAVGAAGMLSWLSSSLVTLTRVGGQVHVGQCLGAKQQDHAIDYATATLQITILFGLLFGLACLFFSPAMISFFKLNGNRVVADAEIYLWITGGFILFSFLNIAFTGLFTAMGNSHTPFVATTVGLIVNILLDPVLIFGIAGIPKMGVAGAGIATVLAQMIVTGMFLWIAREDEIIFKHISLKKRISFSCYQKICQTGFPPALQNAVFAGISMIIARMIASWGDSAVAVQKVGSQIESISWMTADGFASALNAFIAQNYGSRNLQRVKKGYHVAMCVMLVWGTLCTALLVFLPGPIFSIFIPDKTILSQGIGYLKILGYSQLLMCVEITATGALSGMGETFMPSVINILFTAIRIPVAMYLSSTSLGLNGVWWALSLSSMIRGVLMVLWFKKVMIKQQNHFLRES